MTSENITEHIVGILAGLEHAIEPSRIDPPVADVERARRLARRGIPVSAVLRAHRLAQGIALDRLLEKLPRLTSDPELISAGARQLIATMTGYMDRTSEQGVVAFQEERDRRLRWRLTVVNEAGMRIGTTLDIARTTQELADVATEHFADLVTVDLLESALHGHTTTAEDPLLLRRLTQRSVTDGYPESTIAPQQLHTYPGGSPPDRALTTGQPSRHHLGGPPDHSAVNPELNRAVDAQPVHSTLVAPLCARGTTLGVAQFSRDRNPDLYDDDLLLAAAPPRTCAVPVSSTRAGAACSSSPSSPSTGERATPATARRSGPS
ncbi:hypothetical protein OHA27_34635 [Streptomyces sp. NBC_01619]|uniref:hypothetical protein n=1 Tax=Streptomyces sp. NBC_01619 TaxID=2975901 RepID=UPI0022576FD1|nr:hypothetical protein [Streptomyces sp. NBC_01619]MCX4515368.1 hypothetical protein [Streptomyces sp. NBC_01619]